MGADIEVLALERAGWEALSSGGAAATRFYDRVLADEVLMLLPGGLCIDDRAGALEAMGGVGWSSYELFDERVLDLAGDAAVVAYRATARRDDDEYDAFFTSTYVRKGGRWRLALHQQTPR